LKTAIERREMFIGGKWHPGSGGELQDIVNPATGQVIAQVPKGTEADVDKAVAAARKAYDESWFDSTPRDRSERLLKLADAIEANGEELARIESENVGKPLATTLSEEIPPIADCFRFFAGAARTLEGRAAGEYMAGLSSWVRRESLGVVGSIAPWNYPLLMAAWKLGPVLACGCTVVLKPAEQTPLSALRLGELLLEAGLPDGVVNIVTGFGDAGAALAAHDDVDKVAFTGSTEVGKLIVKAAAGNLKKVTLELGGKSPNVVFADADPESAIIGAANGIFFNHGQCCNAGSRLYVQKPIFDDIVAGVADQAKQIKVAPGTDPEAQMGPLISDEQFEKVLGYLDSGRSDGAEAVVGGGRSGDRGYFVQPTVLTNTNPNMKVEREEIFGPVVCASPFGGYKGSGWGREMGHQVLNNYLETKSVVTAL
jgi:phenylacetaldehyde dehydrogenase